MEKKNGKIIFENDKEFEVYAIKPFLVIKRLGEHLYSDVDYTEEYKKDVEDDYKFYMKDFSSPILKHQEVSFRTITKKLLAKLRYAY